MATKRLFHVVALLALAVTFASCGGNGTLPTPGNSPGSASIINRGPNNSLTVSGTIVALFQNGFQIQGGQGMGFFNVYTSSSTQFVGANPYIGENIEATGTGSESMNATEVQQLTSQPTVTGQIVAMITGGFQIQGGPGIGYMNILTNSSTVYYGTRPFVGETVTSVGTGQIGQSLTAMIVEQGTGPSPQPSGSPQPTSSPLLQVSGPIVAMKPFGFQIEGGPGIGYMNIRVNSQTQITGPSPYVGESVTVTGTGKMGVQLTAATVSENGSGSPSPQPTSSPSSPFTPPPTTGFMPSTWGIISPFQVFDETNNGYITKQAAQSDGYRYSTVWGSRWNIGTSWNYSNQSLQDSYYNTLETDESSTGWGAIGHTLSWWQTNHPDWVLYACDSSGNPTNTPAYIPGLNNIPLDVHNPDVVTYQIDLMANYAHQIGYHALAIDEAAFWEATEGVHGGYGCGIYENGQFIRRYTGPTDPNYVTDVIAWVTQAHQMLTSDPTLKTYNLKLIANHPADQLTSNEEAFLANVDADLDETGYSDYGNYQKGSANDFVTTTNWASYAQEHGTAVLMNQNWGNVKVNTPELDYSIATYLDGNEQAESLFASASNGYGLEQYYSQYATAIGAPCGEYYSANDPNNPSIYYRRFANAIVVVNAGSGSKNETANLPSGHTYTDILGRQVSNPLSIATNDGYVLLTSNGCH